MSSRLDEECSAALDALRANGQFRDFRSFSGASKTHISVGDKDLISFSSNDYLGLSSHPFVKAAVREAVEIFGSGSGAARLVSGNQLPHINLEAEFSAFLGFERALLHPSGFQANLSIFSALARPEDLVVFDRAIHASLIDGIRLSRAKQAPFPHGSIDRADELLSSYSRKARRTFLVTESLFSMDGDLSPLNELSNLAKRHGAVFVVDEAHALGHIGEDGRGWCSLLGVKPDILIGTLGKTFGSSGGLILGSSPVIDLIRNVSRPFIFSTAPPPAVSAGATSALSIVRSAEGIALRKKLANNISLLRQALDLPALSYVSPIIPIIFGDNQRAVFASNYLLERGFFIQAIRPPTVPKNGARLRVTVSAEHRQEDIVSLAKTLFPLLPDSK